MTVRALILGSVAAILLGGFGYLNERVWTLTRIVGNHFPVSVFGLLILAATAVNPLLGLLRQRWRLRRAELAVITAMMLAVCSIPGSGLLRTFTPSVVVPKVDAKTSLAWAKVFRYLPPQMMPGGRDYDPEVAEGYMSALRKPNEPFIGLGWVPWGKWRRPLQTWVPILVLSGVAVICIGLVVHRQWSSRERLRYPIALFARYVLGGGPGRAAAPIYRDKLFWLGLGVVFGVHLVNGVHAWWPGFIEIPMKVNLMPLLGKMRWLTLGGNPRWIFDVEIYPTVIAFGTLLASDVALSLGISNILYFVVAAALVAMGVEITGGAGLTGGPAGWQYFGSYLGVALILAYTGRHYYTGVLREAMTFRRRRGVEPSAAWAMRVLLVAIAVLAALVARLGVAWPLAALFVVLLLTMFLVIARINAECGVFFCQANWHPLAVILGLFGAAAVGPVAVVAMALLCGVLTIDPRECLMPFVVNGLKICDDSGVRPARVTCTQTVSFVVVLALAMVVVLWANYNFGIKARDDAWATKSVPAAPFNASARVITALDNAGRLEDSEKMTTFQRLGAMAPQRRFLAFAGAGLALVVVFSYLRLRYAFWPLHPVMFLVWGTYAVGRISTCFLLGWIVRTVTVKLGGHRAYQRVTTFMIGAIAGDMLGGLLFMAVGGLYAAYHAAEGLKPKPYYVFPT